MFPFFTDASLEQSSLRSIAWLEVCLETWAALFRLSVGSDELLVLF